MLLDQTMKFFGALGAQTGVADLWWGNVVMIAIGIGMILLAIIKKYEPLLLVGIGFSCIVSNVPGSNLILEGGLFDYAYKGVQLLILPPLIFFGVGAMTDFEPDDQEPQPWSLSAAPPSGRLRGSHRRPFAWLHNK